MGGCGGVVVGERRVLRSVFNLQLGQERPTRPTILLRHYPEALARRMAAL